MSGKSPLSTVNHENFDDGCVICLSIAQPSVSLQCTNARCGKKVHKMCVRWSKWEEKCATYNSAMADAHAVPGREDMVIDVDEDKHGEVKTTTTTMTMTTTTMRGKKRAARFDERDKS